MQIKQLVIKEDNNDTSTNIKDVDREVEYYIDLQANYKLL